MALIRYGEANTWEKNGNRNGREERNGAYIDDFLFERREGGKDEWGRSNKKA